ncbi:HIG1 domain-containing protein [Plasmodiophora brassicae]|uniref:HIG1 domain-containing protein n=1 Tax=Plasmodiophora brassicae TaxID=37360 RepID=A0A0G4IJ93_PLABS|nr:hypothetical protein PBRA_004005 [Plasmodiophora brassicae]SPQ96309.1 unnamed protein product [Plasmodiophora brassicae]
MASGGGDKQTARKNPLVTGDGTFTSTTTDQSNVRLVDRLMSGGVGTAGMLLTGAVMLSGIIAMTSRKGGLSATTMGYRVFAQAATLVGVGAVAAYSSYTAANKPSDNAPH